MWWHSRVVTTGLLRHVPLNIQSVLVVGGVSVLLDPAVQCIHMSRTEGNSATGDCLACHTLHAFL